MYGQLFFGKCCFYQTVNFFLSERPLFDMGCNGSRGSSISGSKAFDDGGLCPAPTLYVILAHSNPAGFKRREELFQLTLDRLILKKKQLDQQWRRDDATTARLEILISILHYVPRAAPPQQKPLAYPKAVVDQTTERGSHPFVTDNPQDIFLSEDGVRCYDGHVMRFVRYGSDVLWSKENLINIAIEHLLDYDTGAQFIAWIDTDIQFLTDDWVENTLTELRRTPLSFVQMFEVAHLLGPQKEVLIRSKSFASQHRRGVEYQAMRNDHPEYWHPGFAWATTRDMLKRLRASCGTCLPERTLGSADRHIALSLIGRCGAWSLPSDLHESYLKMLQRYAHVLEGVELRCARGSINHEWHGPIANRRYTERWSILTENRFNGERHMTRRVDGLLVWTPEAPPHLLQDIVAYFAQRNEDAISLE